MKPNSKQEAKERAMDSLLAELAERGSGDDETFVQKVLNASPAEHVQSPPRRFPFWWTLAASIAAAVIIVILVQMWNSRVPVHKPSSVEFAWNIKGEFELKKISIPDETGESFRKITAVEAKEELVLTGRYKSVLKIASGSLLKLPGKNSNDEEARRITLLKGFLYAEINSRDLKKGKLPFVIRTAPADVKVTGTRFFVEVEDPKEKDINKVKTLRKIMAVTLIAGTLNVFNSFGSVDLRAGDVASAEEGSAPLKEVESLAEAYGKNYKPIKVDVKPSIPAYTLPLAKNEVGNYDFVMKKLKNIGIDENLLAKNGFVAANWQGEDFAKAYKALRKMEVPVYVTSDSVLHLYHIQFDETLKHIEEVEFIPQLTSLSKAMIQNLMKERANVQGKDAKIAFDKVLAFYAVGYELLTDHSEEIKPLRKCRAKLASQKYFHNMEFYKSLNEQLQSSIRNANEWFKTKKQCLALLDKLIKEKEKTERLVLPAKIREWVDHAINRIKDHQGFGGTQIFTYDKDLSKSEVKWFQEDFSQYVPRGHYTRGYALQRYFMAMMWFGRMTFLIKGGEPYGPLAPDYLIPAEEAKRQTIAAAYLTEALNNVEVGKEKACDILERIYGVTSFFVGLADDITYREYSFALTKALGKNYRPEDLGNDNNYFNLKHDLAKLRKPAIYSGTGASGTIAPGALSGKPSPEELDKALAKTQGFRLMGQRFVPDSYIMGQLVFPAVGKFNGKSGENIFTGGKIRNFPRGLDVMALLGSNRASEILKKTQDSAYEGYDKTFDKLVAQFAEIKDPDAWNNNLYWSWLYCLKGLLGEYGDGYQTYMTTTAWRDKELNTALASWSQLRHDTILYVKQSYMGVGGVPRRPKDFPGYVEPVPEFYARLLALTRLTNDVLSEMKVLDDPTKKCLENTDKLLSSLLEISTKELENTKLSLTELNWIKRFDRSLKQATCGHGADAMKTTLIADVHTDQNTKKVLEEGTGHVGMIVVANRLPDGNIGLAVGPIFSYYEFKHPMADRLTDEKWRGMLKKSKGQLSDKKPKFIKSFWK